jgi:hypothetical protein
MKTRSTKSVSVECPRCGSFYSGPPYGQGARWKHCTNWRCKAELPWPDLPARTKPAPEMTAQEIIAEANRLGIPLEADVDRWGGVCIEIGWNAETEITAPRELIAAIKAKAAELTPLLPRADRSEPAMLLLIPGDHAPAPRQADLFEART